MPRITLKNTPFLAAALPLIAGITLFGFIPSPCPIVFWVIAAAAVITSILADIFLKRSLPVLCTGFMILGFATAWLNDKKPEIPQEQRMQFISRVETIPTAKGRWQNTQSTITAYKDTLWGWLPVCEKTLLSIDISQTAAIGETVTYTAKLYPIDSSYGKYMANQGVFSRSYAYLIDKLHGDTTAKDRVEIWRHRFAENLNTIDTSGLTAALVIGDRRGIGRDLNKDYSRSGVAHILSVSGLHVGIIFVILNIILGWLRIYRRGSIILGCIVILVLCGYAAMTGMSPPVLRSVIMFNLLQIGIMFSRSGSQLNILAASAFLLLLYNPNNLHDIGFQMSYMAMLGIITLFRPLYGLLDLKIWPLKWLWSVTVVTIAAQLGVMPLVVYYFGQLQLVGILLNPIVWFTVPVIIVGGFVYLALGWTWIGGVTAWSAWLQNWIVRWTSSCSWAAIEDIRMPLWVLWAVYAMFIALIIVANNYLPVKKAVTRR